MQRGLADHVAVHHIVTGRERRSYKMKQNLLTRMFAKPASRRDREMAYLNEAVTIYDLERRERDIAGGLFNNR
jgi:hypothetical protein